MNIETIDINKVIRRSGSGYTLHFSDGRKETFPSKKAVENRERQVQYFKHRNKMIKSDLIDTDKLRDFFGKLEYKKLHEYNLLKGKVSECNIGDLLTNPYNKDIDKGKVERIKQDIHRSGKIYPIVYSEVDNDGNKSKMVVDGHHRLQALRDMGHKNIPIVQSDNRGTGTKAPKQNVEKIKRVQRFSIGDDVLFHDINESAWDSGKVVSTRVGNNYQVRGIDGRNRLVNGRDLRRE